MTVNIITADVFEGLEQLPDNEFDCVITSPPYWGLRDYGVRGQIGLEPTLGEHLDVMARLFDEVRRVLHPEGICWMNYGDCYASTPNGRKAEDIANDDRSFNDKPISTVGAIFDPTPNGSGGSFAKERKGYSGDRGRVRSNGGVLKPKDLCLIPQRVAIALQEQGWWVRSEIIWAKPNPMPESVRDRPASSHEKIYMMTKSERYRYDAESVRQNRSGDEDANGFRGGSYVGGKAEKRSSTGNKKLGTGVGWRYREETEGSRKARVGGNSSDKKRGHAKEHQGFKNDWDQRTKEEQAANGRNLRNWEPAMMQVWEMATRPFKDAHFATFPPELVERCLRASGLKPGMKVLDPFGGAGTTGLVAERYGLDTTLIELNPEYVDIAANRLRSKLVRVDGVSHANPDLFAEVMQ